MLPYRLKKGRMKLWDIFENISRDFTYWLTDNLLDHCGGPDRFVRKIQGYRFAEVTH